jgi:hypothetical protein
MTKENLAKLLKELSTFKNYQSWSTGFGLYSPHDVEGAAVDGAAHPFGEVPARAVGAHAAPGEPAAPRHGD